MDELTSSQDQTKGESVDVSSLARATCNSDSLGCQNGRVNATKGIQ